MVLRLRRARHGSMILNVSVRTPYESLRGIKATRLGRHRSSR
jgi:hypothetical protein